MVKAGLGSLAKLFTKKRKSSSVPRKPYKKRKTATSKGKLGKKKQSRRERREKRKHPQAAHQYDIDFLSTKSKFGRRQTKAKRIKKLVTTDSRVDKYALRNYNAWGTGYGANVLQSVQVGAAGAQVESPIHLFDLSAVPQSDTAGAIMYPATHYVLNFSNETDTGVVKWLYFANAGGVLNQVPTDDSFSTTQNKERSFYLVDTDGRGTFATNAAQNNTQFPGAHSILEKFQANLLFYGAQSHCTKFEIALVQLSDDVSPHQVSDRSTSVWQSMHKTWGYSPIETNNSRLVYKHVKFLKRETFMLDSPGAGDGDALSRIRQINFGGYLNRRCNYNWGKYTDRMNIGAEDTLENGVSTLNFATHVHPKARVYMMIRAMVPFKQVPVGTAIDYTTAASYDIHLSVTHRNLVTN